MATSNDGEQGESVTPTESGHIKLQVRTARVQKFITVDENISIKNVSISQWPLLFYANRIICANQIHFAFMF